MRRAALHAASEPFSCKTGLRNTELPKRLVTPKPHTPTVLLNIPSTKQMILKAESTSLLPLGSCFFLYNSFFSIKKLETLFIFQAEMNKTDCKKKKKERG